MKILKRGSKNRTNRENIEDMLKQIFDCEYHGNNDLQKGCDVESIATRMNISTKDVKNTLVQMEETNLISKKDDKIELTELGRKYAIKVVRTHRILEEYIANNTSMDNLKWHTQADKAEHHIEEYELEKIAKELGNPVFDPHGDPIPSPNGTIPKMKGRSLYEEKVEQGYVITHIEDEPNELYIQINRMGLCPGLALYLLDKTDDGIAIVANGEELEFSDAVAKQITVEIIEKDSPDYFANISRLSTLQIGEKAEIIGISHNCKGLQRRRLLDFGFVAGREIKAVIESAYGDTIGYSVLGTTVGLRKQQTELIFIKKQNGKTDK